MRLSFSRGTATLALLNLCVSSVWASPVLRHELIDLEPQLRKRQNPTVSVTGITAFGVQPRLEIRQLEQNTDQWNIFLLGLARFQQTDQSNLTSYYQIAGIHGRPYAPWDDVQPFPGNNNPGYCAHVLNIFLSWHRPYMALFEQTLFEHIIDAVNDFPRGPQRQRYASAALSWRFPYWDWAAPPPSGQSVYPTSMQSPTVNVTTANGTATIPNPLYSYQFHPVSSSDFYYSPFAVWNETKRFPTSWDPDAVSQDAALGPVFDNNRVSFQDRLYNLFTYYSNFSQFGNEAWMHSGGISNADSLESIHDVIHGILGSNGHMTYLDYSAFDPSFWLHHAMIDRCFALWQAIYPDSFVEPMAAIEQTFTIQVGDTVDVNSPLTPFFSDGNRDYWTAGSARSTESFGYTYPELVGGANDSVVKAAINNLYGSSAGNSGLSRRSLKEISLKRRELPGAVSQIDDGTVLGEDTDGKYRQYIANIQTQKWALNSTYAIFLFLGEYNDNPATWATSPNLVGTHTVFAALTSAAASATSSSKRRRDASDIQVTGSMPLTSMLLAKVQTGDLDSMDPDEVEDYLKDNLHWRVAMFDGSDVPVENVADLTVTVVSAEVQPASSVDQFPQWSNFTKLTKITQGKAGGCQE